MVNNNRVKAVICVRAALVLSFNYLFLCRPRFIANPFSALSLVLTPALLALGSFSTDCITQYRAGYFSAMNSNDRDICFFSIQMLSSFVATLFYARHCSRTTNEGSCSLPYTEAILKAALASSILVLLLTRGAELFFNCYKPELDANALNRIHIRHQMEDKMKKLSAQGRQFDGNALFAPEDLGGTPGAIERATEEELNRRLTLA